MKGPSENFPIAPEGLPFLVVTLVVSLAFAIGGLYQAMLLGLCLALYIAFFFRNPERIAPAGTDLLASPADGKVIFVGPAREPHFLNRDCLKISVFMSLFDVHINRAPIDGTVKDVQYTPGRFLAAFDDRACEENERNAIWLQTNREDDVVFVQIAGLVARRIVCYPTKGSFLMKGQRFGLIQFGSRMDVYLPTGAEALVKPGDRVYGGETLLAKLRQGE